MEKGGGGADIKGKQPRERAGGGKLKRKDSPQSSEGEHGGKI